jgi:hypothetical protein
MPTTTLNDSFRGLFAPVGDGRENEPDDIVRVKTAMRRLGYYDPPSYGMTGYINGDLDDGIRAYQPENGLRADGWMKPEGPTYRRLAADLETVSGSRTGRPPIPKLKEDREPPTLFPLGEPRGEDFWGEGGFNARRDGGARKHGGFGFKVPAGSRVPSTVTGRVTALGTVYGRPRTAVRTEPTYRYVEVTTPDRLATRHFYVEPTVKLGDEVEAGSSILGTAQNLSKRYDDKMTNHVHVEVRDIAIPKLKESGRWGFRQFRPLDPARLLRAY